MKIKRLWSFLVNRNWQFENIIMVAVVVTVMSLLGAAALNASKKWSDYGVPAGPSKYYPSTPQAIDIVLHDLSTVSLLLPVTGEVMAQLAVSVLERDRILPPGQPLYLYLDSPGGSVHAGLDFVNFLYGLKRPVYTVSHRSASMAFLIAQMLEDRYITKFGQMFSHPMSVSGLAGQLPGSLETRFHNLQQLSHQIDSLVAKRAGISLKEYRSQMIPELWLDAAAAMQSGYADRVAHVQCGPDMDGSYTIRISIFWGVFEVEFHKCPLITDVISIKRLSTSNSNTTNIFEGSSLDTNGMLNVLVQQALLEIRMAPGFNIYHFKQ